MIAPFFTPRQALFFTLAGAFFYLFRGRDVWGNSPDRTKHYWLTALGCTAALVASGGAFWELARLFPPSTAPDTAPVFDTAGTPAFGVWWVVNNLAGTLCSAGFEEALFRCFLPNRLRDLKVPPRIADSLAIAAFAFAHITAGPWAMANAGVAAAVLLATYRKTRSFPLIVILHGLYNFGGRAILLFAGQ
jgi:membrane protease YdiL (CAAX protease family)